MDTRTTIIVEGVVQQVGYRDFVFEQAVKFGLRGWVKNREDKAVEIMCEGPKTSVEEFIKSINVKQFPILVEDIKATYSKPTGEFKTFEIIWEGDSQAIMERLGTAARYLRDLGSKVDNVGKDVRTVGADVRGVGTKVDELKTTTEASFTKLDTKYDRISDRMTAILEQLMEDRKQAHVEMKELVQAVLTSRK